MSFGEFIMNNIDWITLLGIVSVIITGVATIIKTTKDNKNSVEKLQEEHENIIKNIGLKGDKDKTLREEHDDIKKLFLENGALRDYIKENIVDNIGGKRYEEKTLRGEILDIKEIIKPISENYKNLEEVKANFSKKELDVDKTVENIISLNNSYLEQKYIIRDLENKIKDMEKEQETLRKRVDYLEGKNAELETEIESKNLDLER